MEHILAHKDDYKRLFLEKAKFIKYSLYLFTLDADYEKERFAHPDTDTLVIEYLGFIDKELI